jgi:hypothetical protein
MPPEVGWPAIMPGCVPGDAYVYRDAPAGYDASGRRKIVVIKSAGLVLVSEEVAVGGPPHGREHLVERF